MKIIKYFILLISLIFYGCSDKNIIIPTERSDIECRPDELNNEIFRILDDFKSRGLVPISIKYYTPFDSNNVRIEIGGSYTNNIKVVKAI